MIKIHAHRGASGYAPENTLPAFKLAVDTQSDGIECDIHLSKDGKFIVCHDTTIDRTSNGTGKICEMTTDEIKQYDFGKHFYPGTYAGNTAPTLEEMLDIVKDMDPINIEIKAFAGDEEGALNAFYDILVKYGCVERVLVSSFNVLLLGRLKALHPDVKCGYLYCKKFYERMQERQSDPEWYPVFPPEKALETALEQHCDAVHPLIREIDADYIAAAHEKGLAVNAWTCNTREQAEYAARIGCDGIITNYPDWIRLVLGR